mmetsp:Transcript_21235/g.49408  ORF Transcript_21235/g.49408 Transcript_21235/m.49408 type:complete len:214 (+) Transcript_21235:329-970(+)
MVAAAAATDEGREDQDFDPLLLGTEEDVVNGLHNLSFLIEAGVLLMRVTARCALQRCGQHLDLHGLFEPRSSILDIPAYQSHVSCVDQRALGQDVRHLSMRLPRHVLPSVEVRCPQKYLRVTQVSESRGPRGEVDDGAAAVAKASQQLEGILLTGHDQLRGSWSPRALRRSWSLPNVRQGRSQSLSLPAGILETWSPELCVLAGLQRSHGHSM